MNYLDANILIYAIADDGEKGLACKRILNKIAEGNIRACTCYLSWDEFLFILRKKLGKEAAIVESGKLLNFPNLIWIVVDDAIIRNAQIISEKYSLHARDAIHAASTILSRSDNIISDDSDFDKVKELKRIGIGKS
jgi:uncharacterized protein